MNTLPATIDAEDVAKFSRIADEWWDEKGKFRPLHRINPLRVGYIRDQASAHFGRASGSIKPFTGLDLLDVGCGGGLLCEPFTRLGADVTGIDASEKNIKVAALHAEKMGLSINYQSAAPETLVSSRQYSIVLALEVVEHVSDVPLFVQSCLRLVKPGGLLFMSTLNRTVKSYMMAIIGAEYVLRWLPRGTHDWHKFLKPSELCGLLRKEGAEIADMTGMVFNPLKDQWHLADNNLTVNYMLVATKG